MQWFTWHTTNRAVYQQGLRGSTDQHKDDAQWSLGANDFAHLKEVQVRGETRQGSLQALASEIFQVSAVSACASLWFKQCLPKAAKHAWEETLRLFLSHIFFQLFIIRDGFGAHRAQLATTVEHDEVVEGHVEKAIVLILHLQGFKLVNEAKKRQRTKIGRGQGGQQKVWPSFPVNNTTKKNIWPSISSWAQDSSPSNRAASPCCSQPNHRSTRQSPKGSESAPGGWLARCPASPQSISSRNTRDSPPRRTSAAPEKGWKMVSPWLQWLLNPKSCGRSMKITYVRVQKLVKFWSWKLLMSDVLAGGFYILQDDAKNEDLAKHAAC